MDTLGRQIRSARRALDYSQVDLAERIGVGQQAVSSWERNATVPEHPTLNLLRAVLSVPLLIPSEETPAKMVVLRHLPLKQLAPGQFFALSQTLLETVYSGAQLQIYPDGTSVLHFKVTTPQGKYLGVRCATHRKFHPASLDKVVQSIPQCADEYMLLLNIPVSSRVRERVKQLESWRVWDAHDISELILQAPRFILDAVTDLYFPGVSVTQAPGEGPVIISQPADA